MDNTEENNALVAFTTLAPLSVGGLIGLLLAVGPQSGSNLDSAGGVLLVVGVLGLAASLLHLGRPLRAYRALVRLATSWLSREVWLFGLFLLGLLIYAAPLALDASGRGTLGIVAAVVGVIGLLASGEIYRLHARPAWNHWATTLTFAAGALSAGVLLGLGVSGMDGAPGPGLASATTLAAVLLVVAAALTLLRTSQISSDNEEGRATRRLVFGTYRWTLVVRYLGAALALVLIFMGGSAVAFAWIPAALGELADRIGFYHAVVGVSPAKRYGIPQFSPVPWGDAGHQAGQASR